MAYVPPPLVPLTPRPKFNPPGQGNGTSDLAALRASVSFPGADQYGIAEQLARQQLAAADAAIVAAVTRVGPARCAYCGRYGEVGNCLGCGAQVSPAPAPGRGYAAALDYRNVVETASPAGQAGAGEASAPPVLGQDASAPGGLLGAFPPLLLCYLAYALLWPLVQWLLERLNNLESPR